MPSIQDTVNIQDALKERVEPRVQALIPRWMLLLQLIQRTTPTVIANGRSFIVVLKTRLGQSFRSMQEHEAVAKPSAGKWERTIVPTMIHSSSFDITGLAEEVGNGNEATLIDALDDGRKDLEEAYRENWSRELYLTGDGAVARVESVDVPTKSVVVYAASLANRAGVLYLREGQYVSASDNVTAGDLDTEKPLDASIENIDPTTRTITFDNLRTGDVDVDDYLFIGGKLTPSKNRDWHGLLAAWDDGTLAGSWMGKLRAGAGSSIWQTHVIPGVGTANLERELIIAATTVWMRSKKNITHLISSPGAFNAWALPFLAGRTWPEAGGRAMSVKGGFSSMEITLNGKNVEWFQDPMCFPGTIFGFPVDEMEIAEVVKPKFWKGSDGNLHRSDANLMSRYIFWGAGDLVNKDPHSGFRLDEVTELPAAA